MPPTNAPPINRALHPRPASVEDANTVAKEWFVESAPTVTLILESVSVNPRSLAILTYCACRRLLILNATRDVATMPIASTVSEPINACAMQEQQEIRTRDVAPRRRPSANRTRAELPQSAERALIRSIARVHLDITETRSFSASTSTSARVLLVAREPYASIRPEATIVAAKQATMETPSRCALKLSWTTVTTRCDAHVAVS